MIDVRTKTVYKLSKALSRNRTQQLRGVLLIIIFVTSILILLSDTEAVSVFNEHILIGSLLVASGLYLELLLLSLYSNSVYYRGLASISGSGNYFQQGLTYDAASVLLSNESDITKAFLTSTFGAHIYVRAELTKEKIEAFLERPRTRLPISTLTIKKDKPTALIEVLEHILMLDTDFIEFLTLAGINPDTLRGAASLVMTSYYTKKRRERWWGRDELSRIKPLGTTLTVGAWQRHIPLLTPVKSRVDVHTPIEAESITRLERILQSKRDSNAILIAPDHETSVTISQKLQHSIEHGGLGHINGIFLAEIDHDSILGSGLSSLQIEQTIREILHRAITAGTVTLLLKSVPTLIARYAEHGVTITHIIEEMLTADRAHVLILATPEERLQLQRHHLALLKRCHEVTMKPLSEQELITAAASVITQLESTYDCMFSYNAIKSVSELTATYTEATEATLERLLEGLATRAQKNTVITGDDAARFISHELGIARGPIDAEEKDSLLNLETILHRHIVGQDRAIHTLSSTLRRSRVGLVAAKPVTSFLFLGPSGVGKTETAKVLARHHLKDDRALIRFDMTEFGNSESVGRLLGNETESGRLTDHLTQHPRSIILLDEFEKAHDLVKNLFLQILDEGHITNGQGKTLSLSGSLIIATSNAGSELIAKTGEKRTENPTLDTTIIEHIIREHEFTPELIGRFDEVIIFDALDEKELLAIATQQVTILEQQLRERGYTLVVTPAAFERVLTRSKSALFGARSIRHHISTKIGDAIATEIIRGTTPRGGTITIDAVDIV